MGGRTKWPSRSGNEAVENTAFSSNNWSGKVRKGMDVHTAMLIADVAGHNMDAWADLYKAMNQNHTPKNDVERAHVVYEQLWYTVWATVESKGSYALGVIAGLNNRTSGLYPWDRYPIYVKGSNGTFEYSIFSRNYNDVKNYIHNPKKILKDHADDLQLKVVTESALSSEQVQMYIESQKELAKYDFDQQKAFFETSKRSDFKKHDKVYIYDYLVNRFKNNRLFLSFAENDLNDYTRFIVQHKIEDSELSTWIEKNYIDLLQVDSWYKPEEIWKPKNYVLFGVETSQIVSIYKQLEVLGEDHVDLKNKVWHILQQRIDAIQWDQLYDIVAEVAGTPYEKIALAKLEKEVG